MVFACCWLSGVGGLVSVRGSAGHRWGVWLWVSRAGAAVVIGGGLVSACFSQ